MNRRSFFGLFGGAAVVPFVKVPVASVVEYTADHAATDAMVYGQSWTKVELIGDGIVRTGGPAMLWPGVKALFGELYGPRDDGSEWES